MTVEIKDIADAASNISKLTYQLSLTKMKNKPYGEYIIKSTQVNNAEAHYKGLCNQYINQKLQVHLATRDITELENK